MYAYKIKILKSTDSVHDDHRLIYLTNDGRLYSSNKKAQQAIIDIMDSEVENLIKWGVHIVSVTKWAILNSSVVFYVKLENDTIWYSGFIDRIDMD